MRIVVIGGNFAGFTAAIQIKRKLKNEAEVVVIDRNPDLLYIPSLIWVPIKRREVKEISIPRRPVLEKRGIKFWQTIADRIDPIEQVVYTRSGELHYDQLVIATGPKVQYNIAPGVKEYAYYIGTPDGAMRTREKLEEFKNNPGPIVIGATQQAGCMGAAYEFLFNIEKWLREQKYPQKGGPLLGNTRDLPGTLWHRRHADGRNDAEVVYEDVPYSLPHWCRYQRS